MKNIFCDSKNLTNESQVEALFIESLLSYLDYDTFDIKRKTSIEEFRISKASSKPILYKPDYIISLSNQPFFIIDAKHPKERIDNYVWQCSSYCLELNKILKQKTVKYYLITNGFSTLLYDWMESEPLIDLEFKDFNSNKNLKFEKFANLIGKKSVLADIEKRKEETPNTFKFDTIPLSELNKIFQKLHTKIWKDEKKSPSSAFIELMKLIFVKIQEDKKLHENSSKDIPVPLPKDTVFSVQWIDSQRHSDSPINDPLFKNLVKSLEKDIIENKRKRFFEVDEEINLSPSVLAEIVEELQHIDLFAMDEDVHGRMFETFLDATIRGKDLGQYFTPRDICQLMVELADIKVTKTHIDTVLDACCGSGGFLILAMRDMLDKVKKLSGVTNDEKEKLFDKVKYQSIFGIDAGSDPAMYKIARMNMFLHGDGGSQIYFADALNKNIGMVGKSNNENDKQLSEIRELIIDHDKKFDVILSNPPFSMTYDRKNKEEGNILDDYSFAQKDKKLLKSLVSSVMFIERYMDLVSEGGMILAIIDESILSGKNNSHIRKKIRDDFIIIGIISLPGDAFRRAMARVKTSIIILRKRKEGEIQDDVFMAKSIYLGLDQKIAKRIGISGEELKEGKINETIRIKRDFLSFLDGTRGDYSISSDRIKDRLDVKFCMSNSGDKVEYWKEKGYKLSELGNELIEISDRGEKVYEGVNYNFLKVNYQGEVLDAEIKEGIESSYSNLYKVKTWDILFSNMGAGRGALGIVPPYHDGKYVSNEYTILNARTPEETLYYSSLLRTKEILADILAYGSGMNRGRIQWSDISNIIVPVYDTQCHDMQNEVLVIENYWNSIMDFHKNRKEQIDKLVDELHLEDDSAKTRWLAHKPPE